MPTRSVVEYLRQYSPSTSNMDPNITTMFETMMEQLTNLNTDFKNLSDDMRNTNNTVQNLTARVVVLEEEHPNQVNFETPQEITGHRNPRAHQEMDPGQPPLR